MNMPAAGHRILPAGSALNALDRRATQAMTVGIQGEDCRLGEKTHTVLLDRRPGTDRAGHPAAPPASTRRYVTVLQGEVKPPKAALPAPQDVAEAAQGPGGEDGYVGARSRSVLSAPRHARRRRPVQPRRRPTAPLAQLRPSPSPSDRALGYRTPRTSADGRSLRLVFCCFRNRSNARRERLIIIDHRIRYRRRGRDFGTGIHLIEALKWS